MNGLEIIGVAAIVVTCAASVVFAGFMVGKIFANSEAIDNVAESNRLTDKHLNEITWDLRHRVDALEKRHMQVERKDGE